MNYIDNNTAGNEEYKSNFSIINGSLILGDKPEYKLNLEVGDIVTLKDDNSKIGVVSLVDEENANVTWIDNTECEELYNNLIVLPPSIGLKLIDNTPILSLWENLSNGKSDNFDLKCIYLKDKIINEVPFIVSFKNTDTLIDKKFKRNFSLYRKFGNLQIFRTNLYTIINGELSLDHNRYVYYLLENHVVYYLGIDLSRSDLDFYLFNK